MLGPFRQIRLNMIMSEENAYYFSFKDAGRWSGRWSQTSVCPVTSPPLMQSSCAEGRCLICLAGEPLIPKSVSAGKGLDAARSTPFHAVGLGICTSGPVSEGLVESTAAFVGSTARGWNIVMLCGWAHGALVSKRLVIAFLWYLWFGLSWHNDFGMRVLFQCAVIVLKTAYTMNFQRICCFH